MAARLHLVQTEVVEEPLDARDIARTTTLAQLIVGPHIFLEGLYLVVKLLKIRELRRSNEIGDFLRGRRTWGLVRAGRLGGRRVTRLRLVLWGLLGGWRQELDLAVNQPLLQRADNPGFACAPHHRCDIVVHIAK